MTFIAYCGAFRGWLLHWLLSRPAIVVCGGMCYTIYLYHFFVISLVGRFTLPFTASSSYGTSMFVQTLCIAPPVVIVGAILFKLFEQPFMGWHPRRMHKPSDVAESLVVSRN